MLYQLGVRVFVFLSHTKKIKRLKKKLFFLFADKCDVDTPLRKPCIPDGRPSEDEWLKRRCLDVVTTSKR